MGKWVEIYAGDVVVGDVLKSPGDDLTVTGVAMLPGDVVYIETYSTDHTDRKCHAFPARTILYKIIRQETTEAVQNNDGRKTCYYCNAPTKQVGIMRLYDVCTKCER